MGYELETDEEVCILCGKDPCRCELDFNPETDI